MPYRCLITGGSGYFGSLLVAKLLDRGVTCRILDLNPPDASLEGVEFVQGDIRDEKTVAQACAGMEVIHHNVAQVPLAKDKSLFESVNLGGTTTLLNAAKKEDVRKLIYTSSSAVFGVPKSNPVTEATPPSPGEAYGQAKYEAEKRCAEFVVKGLDVSIIRPRTILGHGRLGIFQILFEWIRQGANVPVLGNGGNLYQFVHADDLASACILAGERRGARTYNIGARQFGTMRQALEAVCKHAATGSRVKNVPMMPAVWGMKLTSQLGLSPLGAYHALMYGRSMYFDVTRAERELDWMPQFSNEEMFIESYDWYLKNRDKVLASHGQSAHRSPVKEGILGLVRRCL